MAAIDPVTGRTRWTYDPRAYDAGQPVNLGFVNRGLAYWTDGDNSRLFVGTGDAHLIALDARTGQPVEGFGDRGRIDLARGLRRPVDRAEYSVTSPPIVCRDVVIVGSAVLDPAMRQAGAPGDVRGFDARTGRLRWTFHTIPQDGEAGADTWEYGSNARSGNTNVWTIMSADEARGILRKYHHGPLFTPAVEGSTVMLPGWLGGASWAGAGLDPETGLLYVQSITAPFIVTLSRPDPAQSDLRFVSRPPVPAEGPRGLPLTKPPYGRVTAISLGDGEHAWLAALGSGPRDHLALTALAPPRLGWPARGVPLVTKTLLFVGQEPRRSESRPSPRGNGVQAEFETREPKLFVFDKKTGELLAEVDHPTNATGGPMTYLAGGRQFIVVPVGGANLPAELVALAMP